jgi:type II secretion system protein N
MSECRVELQVPLINLIELAFINIEADIGFKNRQFQINQCLFKGQQMDGKLSGTITLKNPPGESLLNLTGMIKPHHFFLADLRKSLPANFIPKKRPGSSGFPVRIMGTIEKPGFSLK